MYVSSIADNPEYEHLHYHFRKKSLRGLEAVGLIGCCFFKFYFCSFFLLLLLFFVCHWFKKEQSLTNVSYTGQYSMKLCSHICDTSCTKLCLV